MILMAEQKAATRRKATPAKPKLSMQQRVALAMSKIPDHFFQDDKSQYGGTIASAGEVYNGIRKALAEAELAPWQQECSMEFKKLLGKKGPVYAVAVYEIALTPGGQYPGDEVSLESITVARPMEDENTVQSMRTIGLIQYLQNHLLVNRGAPAESAEPVQVQTAASGKTRKVPGTRRKAKPKKPAQPGAFSIDEDLQIVEAGEWASDKARQTALMTLMMQATDDSEADPSRAATIWNRNEKVLSTLSEEGLGMLRARIERLVEQASVQGEPEDSTPKKKAAKK